MKVKHVKKVKFKPEVSSAVSKLSRQPAITHFLRPLTVRTTRPERILPYQAKKDRARYTLFRKTNDLGHADNFKPYKGFYLVATNNFTEYRIVNTFLRTVQIGGEDIPIDPGIVVATAAVDDDSTLTEIFVERPLRRFGLGRELIRFINECCPQFQVFGSHGTNSRYRLTNDGAALVDACKATGILTDEQVITDISPPQTPSHG